MFFQWQGLQLFDGEGASASATGDGATGVTATDAGPQTQADKLAALGVPESKLAKYRAKKPNETVIPKFIPNAAPNQTQGEEPAQEAEQDAAANEPKAKPSFEELMNDPDYNKSVQKIIQERIKKSKMAEEALSKLTPALELLATKYGLEPNNLEALAKAVTEDDSYYEDKALEMGVPVETAKRIDFAEKEAARRELERKQTDEERVVAEHVRGLQAQAAELAKLYPKFNLMAEMENPAFRDMLRPGSPIKVEDAYFAVHRKEIQAASMQFTAQKTAEKVSASIQAGARRPLESGSKTQGASTASFDVRDKATREYIKQQMREAAARGEKYYPQR